MNLKSLSSVDFTSKKKNKKPKTKGKIAGTLAATAISYVPILAQPSIALCTTQGASILNKNLTYENKSSILQAVEQILNTKGLKEAGVKLNDYRNIEINMTELPDFIAEAINQVFATARGKNAFFGTSKGVKNLITGETSFVNEVVCNMDKLPTAIFHELGHSFNANKSAFWKGMQKMRTPAMLIASLIAAFCALTSKAKPKEEGQELTKGQKVKNFIRNNSGKLAFASMIPVLAEEAMASIRGNSWAKEFLLDPTLAKKVCNGNRICYISYFTAAVASGLSAHLATKIKDKYVQKNNNK